MQETEYLQLILVFTKVAEFASFSQAAKHLNMATSSVSRKIRELEYYLGVKLLERNSRQVALTEIGVVYFNHCRDIVSLAQEATSAVQAMQSEPRGTLRITAPLLFGNKQLGPIISEYLDRYPLVSLQLELSDHIQSLAAGHFDVAIRITNHLDDRLVARKLAAINWIVCASPLYLSRHGKPSTPQELEEHECYHYPRVVNERQWFFLRDGEEFSAQINERVHINSSHLIAQLAVQGKCISLLPTYLVGDLVRSGELVTLLSDYQPEIDTKLYLMYSPNRHTTTAVRCFIDLVRDKISDPPPWDKNL